MGRASRKAGARWEREVANDLREVYGPEGAMRQQQAGYGGRQGADVDTTTWAVECKNLKRCNIHGVLEQHAQEVNSCRLDRLPLVAFRKRGRKRYKVRRVAAMPWDTFRVMLDLIERADLTEELIRRVREIEGEG